MTIYAEIKGWQSAIGSALGFAALICGALFNFHLNRRRDDRLRHEEMVATACALYGEILILRTCLAKLAAGVAGAHISYCLDGQGKSPFDKHFFATYRLPSPSLYDALAPKIGILPAGLLLQVAEFYSNYAEAKTHLPKLETDPDRGYIYGPLWVLRPAMDAIADVKPALRAIEAIADIEPPAGDPPTGDATSVVDMEEETWAASGGPDSAESSQSSDATRSIHAAIMLGGGLSPVRTS